jgi:hypothetical protein
VVFGINVRCTQRFCLIPFRLSIWQGPHCFGRNYVRVPASRSEHPRQTHLLEPVFSRESCPVGAYGSSNRRQRSKRVALMQYQLYEYMAIRLFKWTVKIHVDALDTFVFRTNHTPDPWTCPGALGISLGCQSSRSAHLPGSSLEICSTSLSPRPDRHCINKNVSAPIRTVYLQPGLPEQRFCLWEES